MDTPRAEGDEWGWLHVWSIFVQKEISSDTNVWGSRHGPDIQSPTLTGPQSLFPAGRDPADGHLAASSINKTNYCPLVVRLLWYAVCLICSGV